MPNPLPDIIYFLSLDRYILIIFSQRIRVVRNPFPTFYVVLLVIESYEIDNDEELAFEEEKVLSWLRRKLIIWNIGSFTFILRAYRILCTYSQA